MILNKKPILATALFASVCLLGAQPATAALYHIEINTGALVPDSADQPFSLDLTLIDGGTFTNTFTINNFQYTGGSATGSAVNDFGLATGNLATLVSMHSGGGTGHLTDIYQNFSAGTTDINFDVQTTTVVGGTPDEFAVSILDNTISPIFTSAADTATMASITIGSPVQTAAYQSTAPSPLGVTASVVPEPGSGAAIIGGIGMLLGFRRRKA